MDVAVSLLVGLPYRALVELGPIRLGDAAVDVVALLIASTMVLPAMGLADLFGGDDDRTENREEEDLFGDNGGLDDGFDDFDGLGDEDPSSMGTDSSVHEVEGRLDELENEVGSVSSSISTVRNENEEISETVREIEEHVRDLLDIYEMVTRGVNPFVDEAQGQPFGGGGGAEALGLFEESAAAPGDGDDIDGDLVDAEAESFFDNDLGDPEDADLASADESMGDVDDSSALDDEPSEGDDGGNAGSKSFEELKAEYESGDAEWDADDVDHDDGTEGDDATDDRECGDVELPVPDEPPEAASGPDTGEFRFPGDENGHLAGGGSLDSCPNTRPHLGSFPVEYVADLTAMEWLEDIVDVGGLHGANAALDYYVDIGWIGDEVRDELKAMLEGIGDPDRSTDRNDNPLAVFSSADHRRSLGYIARLAGDTDRTVAVDKLGARDGGIVDGS